MTPEDHELFKKHMIFYETWKKSACIKNFGKQEYNDMVYLYAKYVDSKKTFSSWCSSCRIELVNYLYGWYTNEEHTTWYREQEEVPTPEPIVEVAPAPTKRTRKSKTK